MSPTIRRALILFLFGAVFGTAADLTHVLSATTAYPQGVYGWYLGEQPWWVPPLFGLAAVAIGLSHTAMDAVLGRRRRIGTRSALHALAGAAAFLALYGASGFLPWDTGGLTHLVIASASVAIWIGFDCTWQGLMLAAGTAAAGTLFEILLVEEGVFSYTPRTANFNGVAIWLPWLYAAASVAVGNLARVLQAAGEPQPTEPRPWTGTS
jgi:insulin-induced protein INSIG